MLREGEMRALPASRVHLWWSPDVLDTSSQKIPIRNGVALVSSSSPAGNISKNYIENVFWNIEFRAFCLCGMAAA